MSSAGAACWECSLSGAGGFKMTEVAKADRASGITVGFTSNRAQRGRGAHPTTHSTLPTQRSSCSLTILLHKHGEESRTE